jgi:hypothetical protein
MKTLMNTVVLETRLTVFKLVTAPVVASTTTTQHALRKLGYMMKEQKAAWLLSLHVSHLMLLYYFVLKLRR